jgi:hypothetical protein
MPQARGWSSLLTMEGQPSSCGYTTVRSRILNFGPHLCTCFKLIVTAAPEDRAALRDALSRDPAASYVITEAESGRRALEACRAWKTDCLILDLDLPDLSGLDVLKELAAGRRQGRLRARMAKLLDLEFANSMGLIEASRSFTPIDQALDH